MSEQKKYDEMRKEADIYLNDAIPFLEKAHELSPQDLGTLQSLKDIYTRLKMDDKLQVVNEKINALK